MTKHATNKDGDCILPLERAEPPAELCQQAREFWVAVVDHLHFAGIASRVDAAALRVLASCWVDFVEAEKDIRENGINHYDGKGGVKANPACRLKKQSESQLISGLKEFGLTPRGRVGIKTDGKAGQTESQKFVDSILNLGGRMN